MTKKPHMAKTMEQVFFCLVLMDVCLSGSLASVHHYRTGEISDPDYSVIGTPTTKTMYKRSRIECSIACSQDDRCLSISYDKSQKECNVSTGPVADKDTATFEKDINCPDKLGYKLLIYHNITLCLRYNPTAMNHSAAKAICEADGGHLALIESSTMHRSIAQFVVDLSMNLDFTYFDGYDSEQNNTYRSWKGDILPWIQWQGTNPDNRAEENCIVIQLGDGQYFFRDFYCYWPNPSLCQLEIYRV